MTGSSIRVELPSPAHFGLGIISTIILPPIHVWPLEYMRVTLVLRLLGVRNYLNNYFSLYKRVTRSRLHVELASAAYLELAIIKIIIVPSINIWRAPVYA